jgi:polysaccharide pyruvyl transferase WcaK-like protein
MNLAIFGSYNGTSIGDTAILLGLLHGIAQAAPEARVTVLTMGPLDLSRDLALCGLIHPPLLVRANIHAPAEWPVLRSLWWRLQRLGLPLGTPFNPARVRKALAGQNLLLIGGGNLLMDLFSTGVELIENITCAAKTSSIPYSFAGVGVGPVAHASSAARLAACLAPAQRVVVRDANSRALCIETLRYADTQCAPDLAFALPPFESRGAREALAVNVAAVGAHTWPVKDPRGYQLYLNGMVRLVLDAAAQTRPARIEIITTNTAVDLGAAQDLAARLNGKTTVPVLMRGLRDVTDILESFGRAKLAIITRLHAGITAALAGAPVLPVAYQPKVAAVLRETGIVPQALAMEVLQSPEFDTASTLSLAIRQGGCLRPETRTQALAAIRDLLPVSGHDGAEQ